MRRPAHVWAACLGGLIALDIWCDRNAVTGDSLSECVRAALRTHTPAGKAAFLIGWASLTAWFCPHICRTIKES